MTNTTAIELQVGDVYVCDTEMGRDSFTVTAVEGNRVQVLWKDAERPNWYTIAHAMQTVKDYDMERATSGEGE